MPPITTCASYTRKQAANRNILWEVLGFWTLSSVWNSKQPKTWRFGNWIWCPLQVRGGRHSPCAFSCYISSTVRCVRCIYSRCYMTREVLLLKSAFSKGLNRVGVSLRPPEDGNRSKRFFRRIPSSGMWRHVGVVRTDVSKEYILNYQCRTIRKRGIALEVD
jgi:hypothetical protein